MEQLKTFTSKPGVIILKKLLFLYKNIILRGTEIREKKLSINKVEYIIIIISFINIYY